MSLIVVAGSDDQTPHLIYTNRPERTKVLRSTAHIAIARNIGGRTATTPWLLFTDADVSFEPDYCVRIQQYGAAAALFGPKLSQQSFRAYYRWFFHGQRLLARLKIPARVGIKLPRPARCISGNRWL